MKYTECPYCGGELDESSGVYECQGCLVEFECGDDGLEEIEHEDE